MTAEVVELAAEEEISTVVEAEAVRDTEATFTVVVATVEPEVVVTSFPAREMLTLGVADADPDAELEDEPMILNGKEYWKVEVLESRVSLKPYVV